MTCGRRRARPASGRRWSRARRLRRTNSCSRSSRRARTRTWPSTSLRAPTRASASPRRRWHGSTSWSLLTGLRVLRRGAVQARRDLLQRAALCGGERAYAAVLGRDASSAFRQQALYKHGWSLFKQSRDEESSASFLALLDGLLAAGGRTRPSADLSRPEQELSADAMRALAITFAASEGPAVVAGGARPSWRGAVRVTSVSRPRRPVRREGALPGRRRSVPGLRAAPSA
jgi:hypothetical protein